MSQYPKRRNSALTLIFFILLAAAIAVWLLRGFAVLTFIPGGSIWILILLSVATGILSYLQIRWRRF